MAASLERWAEQHAKKHFVIIWTDIARGVATIFAFSLEKKKSKMMMT